MVLHQTDIKCKLKGAFFLIRLQLTYLFNIYLFIIYVLELQLTTLFEHAINLKPYFLISIPITVCISFILEYIFKQTISIKVIVLKTFFQSLFYMFACSGLPPFKAQTRSGDAMCVWYLLTIRSGCNLGKLPTTGAQQLSQIHSSGRELLLQKTMTFLQANSWKGGP